MKKDKTKLFIPSQYLTKNQIRNRFGKLARKKANNRQVLPMIDDDDDISVSSEHDRAECYFKIEREQELRDMKHDILDDASNCYSDDEDEFD